MRSYRACALGLGLLLAAGTVRAQEGADDEVLTFGSLEIEVKSEEREGFEGAVSLTKADRCEEAIFKFWDLLQNTKAKEFHDGSDYYIAKCLYRLGFYHSALKRFELILEKGDKNPYFQTSREWLFFISRKLKDQGAVLDTIARYSTAGGVPAKYADEFHYLLGKHYYMVGLGDLVPKPDEGRASEAEIQAEQQEEEDGFDFGEDSGGGGGDVGEAWLAQGGGFDFSSDDVEKPKKKAKPRSRKGRKAPRESDERGDDETPAEAAAPAADEKSFRSGSALPAGEAMDRALVHLEQVPEGTKFYAKARYLHGLVLFQREEYERSVQAFRDVIRLTHPKTGRYRDSQLREQSFFSLARTHYGFQQFRYALFYYDKIDHDSEAWLEALFESSWAYFRLGMYEKSLGNLITLHSPFFVDEYFPESIIVRALTYFENCRYPEARGLLDDFERDYGQVRDRLIEMTKESKTAEQYYQMLDTMEGEGASDADKLTVKLVRLAMTDKGLRALNIAIEEIDDELKRMGRELPSLPDSPLGQLLQQGLTDRRETLVGRAGAILREKLAAERDDLKSLSSQLYRIKFEIAKMEKQQIEAQMRGESMVVPLEDYRFNAVVDDEHEFYPFTGEYWRDELGTYEYTLTQGCRPEAGQ